VQPYDGAFGAHNFGRVHLSGVPVMGKGKTPFGRKNVFGKSKVQGKKTVYGTQTKPPKGK
jgi:hypothetical protein